MVATINQVFHSITLLKVVKLPPHFIVMTFLPTTNSTASELELAKYSGSDMTCDKMKDASVAMEMLSKTIVHCLNLKLKKVTVDIIRCPY